MASATQQKRRTERERDTPISRRACQTVSHPAMMLMYRFAGNVYGRYCASQNGQSDDRAEPGQLAMGLLALEYSNGVALRI